MFQTNEQDKSPETDPNEMEITDLPYREFRIMVAKMLTKLRRTMHKKIKISTKKQKT